MKKNKSNTKGWSEIKDEVYGKKGTRRRDDLERNFESFKVGLQLKKMREQRNLTQAELGLRIDKKREYISRIENNGSNLTLKTLYEVVEIGLGGKVKIKIDIK
jgi:DNA-binding XRE family transcriptional regulator